MLAATMKRRAGRPGRTRRIMGARASREKARELETLAAREHMYGQFDTVIVTGGSEMPCHREVLMEHSAYFR